MRNEVNTQSTLNIKKTKGLHSPLGTQSFSSSLTKVNSGNGESKEESAVAPMTVSSSSGAFTKDEEKKQFMSHLMGQANSIYVTLRNECNQIEENMKKAEDEVRHREEISFILQKNEQEISRMQTLQQVEIRQKKEAFVKLVEARNERKTAKRTQRNMMRQTKHRDRTIMLQEEASKAAKTVREILADKRTAFDALITHMETAHEKQRKQLSAAQLRKFQYEKMINDLETKHLKVCKISFFTILGRSS
jgi:hypothetical protein